MIQTQTPDTLQGTVESATGLVGLFQSYPLVETALWVVGIILLAWLADNLTVRVPRLVRSFVPR